jgi:hypothetical protein
MLKKKKIKRISKNKVLDIKRESARGLTIRQVAKKVSLPYHTVFYHVKQKSQITKGRYKTAISAFVFVVLIVMISFVIAVLRG